MKIAFVTGEGIGNQIEALPAFNLAKIKYPNAKFDIINTIHHCFWFTEFLYNHKLDDRIENIYSTKTVPNNYTADGKIVLPYVKDIGCLSNVKNLSLSSHSPIERMYNSEISTNILTVSHDKFPESIFDVKPYLEVSDAPVPKYDIVIHNGCNKNVSIKNLWDIKKYKEFHKIAKYYTDNGYGVCSIGSSDEYIENTVNETGKSIEKSIELIRKCRLFISNDTGTYHIAAALRKPGIVLFTATSPWKNSDKIFHKTINIVRRTDLPCSPCQKKGNGAWLKCTNQKCKIISPDSIITIANKLLGNNAKKSYTPKVSIITRTFNRLEYTIDCVKNVHRLAGMQDYEHIIIDQGSTDGTQQWLNSIRQEGYYNRVKMFLSNSNKGDAGGMKLGFNIANPNSKYIMQFDNDCKPLNDNFLERLVKMMDKYNEIGIIMMMREGVHTNINPVSIGQLDKEVVGEIGWATCCFIIRREILEKANFWIEGQQIGWGKQISKLTKDMGYKIFKTIENKIEHIDGTTLQALKFPLYHNSVKDRTTNYREIKY